MLGSKFGYLFTQYADRVGTYTNINIFTKFSRLAMQTQSANLGQGFPDYQPPMFLRDNLIRTMDDSSWPVLSPRGDPQLISSVKRFFSNRLKYKVEDSSILISHGATTCLSATINAFVNPGDEVIIIDPSFDIYRPLVEFAGGRCVGVHLIPRTKSSRSEILARGAKPLFDPTKDSWDFDWKGLRDSITPRTKAIIINTPQNPIGKIFSIDEIQEFANILKNHPQIVVISDEAYSHICFEPYSSFRHPRTLENAQLANRTVSIYSIGKIFSSSGLRLGACIGDPSLINAITTSNEALLGFVNSPFQRAAALSFDECDKNEYFEKKALEYQSKAQYLLNTLALSDLDFGLWMPQGGYFLISDVSKVPIDEKFYHEESNANRLGNDSAFVYRMINERKIVGIPIQTFYDPDKRLNNQNLVRWAFCKDHKTLSNASEKMLGKSDKLITRNGR